MGIGGEAESHRSKFRPVGFQIWSHHVPHTTTPIWMLTLGLLITHPLLAALYWGRVLAAGVLPHDGDAIAIPIFGALLFTMIVAPFVIGTGTSAYERSW